MHSFCKIKEDYIEDEIKQMKVLLKKKTYKFVDIEELEFGWGYEFTNEFDRKLAYIIATFQSTEEALDALEDTNITKIILPTNVDEEDKYGYIDHQSYGELKKFLETYDISLKEFLLNPQYAIIVDNDNSCAFAEHYGIKVKDKIEKLYGMYDTEIEELIKQGYTEEQFEKTLYDDEGWYDD